MLESLKANDAIVVSELSRLGPPKPIPLGVLRPMNRLGIVSLLRMAVVLLLKR
jgi:hypothetical protein